MQKWKELQESFLISLQPALGVDVKSVINLSSVNFISPSLFCIFWGIGVCGGGGLCTRMHF